MTGEIIQSDKMIRHFFDCVKEGHPVHQNFDYDRGDNSVKQNVISPYFDCDRKSIEVRQNNKKNSTLIVVREIIQYNKMIHWRDDLVR